LKPLQFHAPATLAAALSLLSANGKDVGILSGGTDLIIQHRAGRRQFGHMLDIKKIPELNVLAYDDKTGLRLGAAVCCDAFTEFGPAAAHYPGLVEGAELIGSTQIQNRATVGGNVCNGSPAADTICSLMVLDAECILAGPKGQRTVPARDFMTGPGQTALKPGELLLELHVPPRPARSSDAYLRFIPRNEMDIAVAGAAAALTLAGDGRTVAAAAIAIGAVGPTPIAVPEAAQALLGKALGPATLAAAARAAEAAAQPISDVRGPAEYRRHLAGVLTRRAIELAAQRIAQGATA
jgi:CO/xanthine dehydrogenase FAD-binding subunit